MVNSEKQLEIHGRGVECWNKWREENKETEIILSNSNFEKADLENIDLSYAKLVNCDFSNAMLFESSFFKADLRGSKFKGANLEEANMIYANLEEVEFQSAYMRDAMLAGTNLKNANMYNSNLEGVNFRGAILTNVMLSEIDLTASDLGAANLEHASLWKSKYYLDSTYTRNAILGDDPWSILRRKYTGSAMLWTILALLGASMPYAAKALYWSAFNQYQNWHKVPLNDGLHQSYRVAEMIIGMDKGWVYSTVTLSLLLYNTLRGFLTYKVSQLREEEDRSGYSPNIKEYKHLIKAHVTVKYFGYFATAIFLFNSLYWLSRKVWVPL